LKTSKSFTQKLYTISDKSFDDLALEVFQFQAINNPVYNAFIHNLRVNIRDVRCVTDIPFLPISFFKTQNLQTLEGVPEVCFTSSGTTGMKPSMHPVLDLEFYLQHSKRCFEYFFGSITDYHFFALLPSYLERQGSSLIAMIDYFIKNSGSALSGFYLGDHGQLLRDIASAKQDSRKIIVWGVSFALLDLIEKGSVDLSNCYIFETGGMKGRRKEITREELHSTLRKHLNVQQIYSEYGMTELLSQAYTTGKSDFSPSPWMKCIGRDISDPMHKGLINENAGLNIIDLANWATISFIETEDIGKVYADGRFEVLGRMDNSDIRGCNLLVS
jgi:phenylacetate-coenzyme A ligase PaaK-like adenylate-forming protein